MSRTKPFEGMPYLFNPRNQRVMVATEAKAARKDEYGKPYFIPCMEATGPDGTNVRVRYNTGQVPVMEDFKPKEDQKVDVSTPGDLLEIVLLSEDKDELVKIGADIGIKLAKTMKVATMQKKIAARLEEV
jgi:hypothetical protein